MNFGVFGRSPPALRSSFARRSFSIFSRLRLTGILRSTGSAAWALAWVRDPADMSRPAVL